MKKTLDDVISQVAHGDTGQKSMVSVFDKVSHDGDQMAVLQEEQSRFYLRSGNEKALRIRIESIAVMKKDPLYKDRFQKGYYDPVLLKAELAVLDAQEGENQWLKGERFAMIRDTKLYKAAYGYTSFEDFIRNDTPYARSTVYNWIKVYEQYSYEQSVKLGSKLSLFTQSIALTEERDQKDVIENIEGMSFREAKAYVSQVQAEKPTMNREDIKNDTFGEYVVPAREDDIPTVQTKQDHHEPVGLALAPAYMRAKATGTGTLKIGKFETEALSKKHYPVLVGLDNEILQKYYLQAIQAREGSIRGWIEAELLKPENKADLKALLKIQKAGK